MTINYRQESPECARIKVGDRFGRLVLRKKVHSVWVFDCDCGRELQIIRSQVVRRKHGTRKSCGKCEQTEYQEPRKYERAANSIRHEESTLAPDVYKLLQSTRWVPEWIEPTTTENVLKSGPGSCNSTAG